ncbi:SDR family oxidoreductase [Gordonia sp. HY285]|uniref:SDR family NAD(P)-dependent oxidoreductase n=1 Tax=Gordonia liuliyuniae TaxID=2911517 RepID=UPI001F37919C|nr:SDR family NAD(P)-dependent oxidoreductase [Gordonia liuliyuniae]MCF8608930.1 SDR family oxidoreductase [Gordonia liuliyuniae]
MSASELLDLSGRVALVTGAGQGVGHQIAATLAEYGASVIVNDFDLDRAKRVADEICTAGHVAMAARADVGDFDQVNRMFSDHGLGPVSIVVNNAGNGGAGPTPTRQLPFWEQRPADWERFLRVNLDGVLNVTQRGIAQMVPNGWGRVITIISDAGRVGESRGMEAYSGAKAGAAGFTRAIARLGGQYGITANCISLGATRTPAIEAQIQNEAFTKKVLSNYIVRRFGEPSDAANAALFLSSEAASYITGQTLPVNGGFSLTL